MPNATHHLSKGPGSTIKISWVILTYNRAQTVKKAMTHNMALSGHPWHEVIWCDNGSKDGVRDYFLNEVKPDVAILNKENLGVAKGYNRATVLSTGTHVLITGCDRLMPEGFLKDMVECFEKIPNTGVVSIYSKAHAAVPERFYGKIPSERILYRALPMEARLIRKEVIARAGHLREDFGLYGHEDIEYGHRCKRVCDELGLLYYTLPLVASHLGTEGVEAYDGKDDKNYHEFKKKETNDPKKEELLKFCRENKYPYYTPYV